MIQKSIKAAFPHTLPVMAGYLFLGMAFGILLESKGYGFGWAVLMSVTIYAGSMQFVAVGLLTAGFHPVHTLVMTLMVNARHVFYGLSMLPTFRNMKRTKPYMIFSLTDETFSLLCSVEPPKHVNRNLFYLFIALLDHSYWITGSAIGSLLGSSLPVQSNGIDFVMTALFVVIFMEQWDKEKEHGPALIGVGSTILCLILFGPKWFILPTMAILLLTLTVIRPYLEGRMQRREG